MTLLTLAATACAVLAGLRILRGPSQADRLVALDLLTSSGLALIAAAASAAARPVLLDVGIGLGVVGFVGAIAWARLIESTSQRERK
jgi:multicomponent Na+:H+ antiporter subunit F